MSKKVAQEIAITLEALIDFAHERGLHLNNLYEVGDGGVPMSMMEVSSTNSERARQLPKHSRRHSTEP